MKNDKLKDFIEELKEYVLLEEADRNNAVSAAHEVRDGMMQEGRINDYFTVYMYGARVGSLHTCEMLLETAESFLKEK